MQTHLLPGAEPFFYEEGEIACLLMHGFTSTPHEFREMGGYLRERGIATLAPLLPGHGTSPHDLRGRTWHDWYGVVGESLDQLLGKYGRVYVAGLSLGGALALHTAAQRGQDLAGVVAISAPVLFPPGLSRVLKRMQARVPFLRKPFRDIQDREARRKHVSYLRAPVDATASVVEFGGIVRRELRQIRIPALVIHARRDHVVHIANGRYLYYRLGSPLKSLLVLNRGFHIATVDRDRHRVYEAVMRFVTSEE